MYLSNENNIKNEKAVTFRFLNKWYIITVISNSRTDAKINQRHRSRTFKS
jgi:hypothetical protein